MKQNPYPGKFVVFEGIDGAGSESQSKLLFNYLKKQKRPVERLTYPDYQTPIGKLIHQFLYEKYDFSSETQFLLYFVDFIKDKEKIDKWLKQGKIIISDRYFSSTIAYQCLKGFLVKHALEIAKFFKPPKPNLVIYLKISPQTSIKRKFKEKKKLDRHEKDREFLKKLTRFYEKLARKQIFGKWIIINGERSIKEVSGDVKKVIAEILKI